MSSKNAVAAERRMDLASLFCMIGRHGPAVALAIIAVASVLAGFIIYRTVRGKRRKATYGAAEGDGKSPGEDGDVPLVEAEQERSRRSAEDPRSPAESTDVSDKGSSDVKEDAGRILSDLKVRHRRTAANKKPPPYCSPKSISVPGNKDNAPTAHDCYEEAKAYTEETNQSPRCDTQVDVKGDREEGLKDDYMKDAEDDHDSCMTAGLVSNESHKEEEKVLKAKFQEIKNVTTDKDVSDEKTSQVEGNMECVSNSPVCFEQNVHLSENRDDTPKVQETTPDNNDIESSLEHPVIPIEDVSIVCSNKDVEIEDIDYSEFCGSNRLSPRDETNCHQDQCDDVKDEVILPNEGGDWNNDHGGSGEVTEEDEGQLNNLKTVEFSSQTLQTDKQQLQPEQQNENGHTCNQEDGVNAKMLTSSGEEHESPSVVLTSPLPCLNQLEKIDNGGDCQFGATANAKSEISGTMDFPDLSLDYQEPQSEMKEDVSVTSLDLGTDLNIVTSDPSSLKVDFESEKNGTTAAEESVECLVSSCYEDQKCNFMENIERMNSSPDAPVSAEAGFTASVISTDPCDPNMSPSLQDKQSDQMQNNADFPEVTNTNQPIPVVTESIKPQMCHIHFPSFEQTDLSWSSTGLGEESGISSMTVSPDLQDASVEFDITPEKLVVPFMDRNPQSEEPTESQGSLFADDVAVSVINEDSVGVAFGSSTSGLSQQPHSDNIDCVSDKSFLTNEDIFGHAIEDRYHREMGQFMEQMVDSAALTDEMKKETVIKADVEVEIKEQVQMQRDMKSTVKVAGIKEKKKKEGTEEEEEEEIEKTEISIMEATMDNNEWMTDGNCQVLPWMNLSVPAFAQNHAKPEPLPSDEQQNTSSVADVPCQDVPSTAEVRQLESLSTVDESTESNKKVVAVQPMPQNVNVTFRIHYLTQSPYQKVAITGNQQELGNWKDFIPLERDSDGHWSTVVSLPAESHVEWKFVVVDKGAVCRWEECGNRLLDTGYGDELLVHKWWGTL